MSKLTAFIPSTAWEYEVIFGFNNDYNEDQEESFPFDQQDEDCDVIYNTKGEQEKNIKQPKSLKILENNNYKKESKVQTEVKENKNEEDNEIKEIPKKEKKYWSFEQKRFAVEKARLIGLIKAAKFLQISMPETYGDLSPSTLQYWVKKDRQWH